MSGLPDIDVDDWKKNTEYSGYEESSNVIQVCMFELQLSWQQSKVCHGNIQRLKHIHTYIHTCTYLHTYMHTIPMRLMQVLTIVPSGIGCAVVLGDCGWVCNQRPCCSAPVCYRKVWTAWNHLCGCISATPSHVHPPRIAQAMSLEVLPYSTPFMLSGVYFILVTTEVYLLPYIRKCIYYRTLGNVSTTVH